MKFSITFISDGKGLGMRLSMPENLIPATGSDIHGKLRTLTYQAMVE